MTFGRDVLSVMISCPFCSASRAFWVDKSSALCPGGSD